MCQDIYTRIKYKIQECDNNLTTDERTLLEDWLTAKHVERVIGIEDEELMQEASDKGFA